MENSTRRRRRRSATAAASRAATRSRHDASGCAPLPQRAQVRRCRRAMGGSSVEGLPPWNEPSYPPLSPSESSLPPSKKSRRSSERLVSSSRAAALAFCRSGGGGCVLLPGVGRSARHRRRHRCRRSVPRRRRPHRPPPRHRRRGTTPAILGTPKDAPTATPATTTKRAGRPDAPVPPARGDQPAPRKTRRHLHARRWPPAPPPAPASAPSTPIADAATTAAGRSAPPSPMRTQLP